MDQDLTRWSPAGVVQVGPAGVRGSAGAKINATDLDLLVCTDDPAEVEQIVVDCFQRRCAEATAHSEARG